MATLYAKTGISNFNDANGWNSQADGGGTDYTATDSGGGVYIVNDAGNTLDLNGLAVTLNVDVTAALIQSSNSAGYLTVSGTRVINGNVTYSTSGTSGMVRYTTGASLTINGQVTNSSSGYNCVGTGSGAITISNVGGIAIDNTGSGRCVYHYSSGECIFVGDVQQSSNGIGAFIRGNCTATITGDVSHSGNGTAGYALFTQDAGTTVSVTGNLSAAGGSALWNSGATSSISGNLSSSGQGMAVMVASGVVQFVGASTLAAESNCYIILGGGTLALATASAALTLTNSGNFVIYKTGGTLTKTAAGGTAAINCAAGATAAIIGDGAVSIISYPAGAGGSKGYIIGG